MIEKHTFSYKVKYALVTLDVHALFFSNIIWDI